MARDPDGRKRARKGSAPPEPPAAPEPMPDTAEAWVAREEPMVFADDPAPAGAGSRGRVSLPSSGLAADILAREEARQVEPAFNAVPAAPAPAAPARTQAAAQSLSFFAVPVQEQRVAAEAMEHLATFSLDREEYGVEVRLVQEIRRVTEITVVPRAPEFVRGVINLRGRILPVVDLKKKLGLGEVAIGKTSRIVVVRLRDRLLGLLVDSASQVLKVPLSRIEPPPDEVLNKGGDTIRGVAKLENRLVILLDLPKVLAQELREGPAQ